MKTLRDFLIVLSLIFHSYFPVAAISAAIFDLNVRIYSPAVLSALILAVTLAALVFSFICSTPSLINKTVAPIITLFSVADFSVFFIFADNDAATVFCILSFVLSVILTVKTFSFIVLKILFPIAAAVLGVVAFSVSVILAVALALGNRAVTSSSLSPDGKYRAEITSKNAIVKNGYSVVIYDTDNEVRLPFIHLFSDGEAVYSDDEINPDDMSWEDSDTLIVKGERITVEN